LPLGQNRDVRILLETGLALHEDAAEDGALLQLVVAGSWPIVIKAQSFRDPSPSDPPALGEKRRLESVLPSLELSRLVAVLVAAVEESGHGHLPGRAPEE